MTDFPRLPPTYALDGDAREPHIASVTVDLDSHTDQADTALRAALGLTLATYGAEDTFSFHVYRIDDAPTVCSGQFQGASIEDISRAVGQLVETQDEGNVRVLLLEHVKEALERRKAPLQLRTHLHRRQLVVEITASPVVFPTLPSASRFLKHVQTAFTAILNSPPTISLADISLQSPGETLELDQLARQGSTASSFDPSSYPSCTTLAQTILSAAETTPDAEALVFDSLILTFRQLIAISTSFAHHIRSHLPTPEAGHVVTLCLPKSEHQLIALLAVTLSGSAYLNFEPSMPEERKKGILKDLRRDGGDAMWSGVALVDATEAEDWQSWSAGDREELLLRHVIDPAAFLAPIIAALPRLPSDPISSLPTPRPQDPAYIIYTSGSTGAPKGIVVEHRNVVAFLRNYRGVFGREVGDRILAFPSYGFDVMVVNIWNTWAHSAAVALTAPSTLFSSLPQAILDLGITVVDLTPTVSTLLFEYSDSIPKDYEGETVEQVWRRAGFKIKQVNTGGERVEAWARDRWNERGVKMVIDYGPSETTVGCIANISPSPGINPIPIGRPMGANIIQLLSPSSLTPVPRGCVGEICVTGEQVSRGYLQKSLNDGVFVTRDDGTRVYRTGDWGRWTEDGMIDFIGRRDGMVKVNGLRIEIGEIENRLDSKAHSDLRSAVVEKLDKKGIASGLVAFLVFRSGTHFYPEPSPSPLPTDNPSVLPLSSSPEYVAALAAIRSSLSASLPIYMVPRYFIPISHIPTAGMGKTDRKRLRQLAETHSFRSSPTSSSVTKSLPAERRQDEWHDAVRRVWARVLKMDTEEFEDEDVFSRLGGDSIAFLKVVSLLRGEGYAVSFAALQDTQTLSAVAFVVQHAGATPSLSTGAETAYVPFSLIGGRASSRKDGIFEDLGTSFGIPPGDIEDVYPTAPAQDAILAAAVDSDRFYAQAVYSVEDRVDTQTLVKAVAMLVERHPAMRTVFVVLESEDSVLQIVLNSASEAVQKGKVVEIRDGNEETVTDWLDEERKAYTLEWARLSLRFVLFTAQDDSRKLVWSMHHAMSDGWMLELLIADLRDLCTGREPLSRPPFATVAAWWQGQRSVPQPTADFWRSYLVDARSLDWPPTKALSGQMLCTSSEAAVHWRGDLRLLTQKHGITPAIASRVAIAVSLSHHASRNDVCLGIVRSGRDIDVEDAAGVVGPCVSVLPSRIQASSSTSLLDLSLAELRADRQSRAHQRVTLSDLGRVCGLDSRSDLFNILVTYQSLAERDEEEGEDRPWPIQQPPSAIRMPTNYTLSFEITPERHDATTFEFSCFYDQRVISSEGVANVLSSVQKVMEVLSMAPCTSVGELNLDPEDIVGSETKAPPAETTTGHRASSKELAPLLETLLPIWAQVLRLDVNEIAPSETFSSLGGDSIAMMRLSVALKRNGFVLPPGRLARLPTLLEQASWLLENRQI